MIFGMPHEFGHKFFTTMCEWTNVAYIAIVLLPRVSRENLAFNAAGFYLGMVAIVATLDGYVQQMCYLFDFASIAILGLGIVAADGGKNAISTKFLTVASALYAVVQLDLPGKGTEWFSALISSSSLAFSLCLLIVMYGREDATTLRVSNSQNTKDMNYAPAKPD
jgi:hypothetical protein